MDSDLRAAASDLRAAAASDLPGAASGLPAEDLRAARPTELRGYGQPPAGGFTPPPVGPKVDPLGIVALVCGILGFLLAIPSCCCGPFICIAAIPGVAGLVCGILSVRRIKREPDRYGGAGLAIGGIVTSAITVLGTLVMAVLMAISIATSPSGSYDYGNWNSYGGGSDFDWD